jgi:hypothetical protein
MIDRDLYDKQDLDNKIIIWHLHWRNEYKSFKILSQRIGLDGMNVGKCDLFRSYGDTIFWKQDTDFPQLFVVKKLYRSV